MSYQPIENYGIIGNMRTVALVLQLLSIHAIAFELSRCRGGRCGIGDPPAF